MTTQARAACDTCSWTGTYSSQAQAAYAHRRHSCDTQRIRDERAARVAARKAASGPVRDCTCPGTFHEHGTRNAYVVDKCRCRPCRDAAAAYERRRAKDRAYGREAYLDAAPVRAHIEALQAQGMGWKRVAAAAGIDTSVVWKIIYGDVTRGLAPTKRVMPKTHAAITGVTLDLAPGAVVDGTGTRRRLQALVTLGWSMSELARRLDVLPSNFGATIHGRKEVTVATANAATALYEQLWDVTPPPTGRHGSVPIRARNYATRMDWAPPMAWDDATIDDPRARPHGTLTGVITDPRDPDDVDPANVQRAIDGYRSDLTRAERIAAIRTLAAAGHTDRAIAEHVHTSARTVVRDRTRHAIPSRVEPGSGQVRAA